MSQSQRPKSVEVRKLPDRHCVICDATDKLFVVTYRDPDNQFPIEVRGGFRWVPPNAQAFACIEHLAQAVEQLVVDELQPKHVPIKEADHDR